MKKAFTLKKFLVVIFIIGILIAFLLPAIRGIKERGWGGHAASQGDLERLQKGVADGVIRPRDYPGIVRNAARHGHLEICRYFIEELLMPVPKNSGFVFPAMQSGNNEILQYFLDKGAVIDPAAKHESNQTLLHAACIGGNVDFCKILLDKKAKLEVVDKKGMTPLWHAAAHGHDEVFQLLVDAGAVVDTELMLPDGAYLIHIAAKGGSGTICRFLLDKGVDVNLPSNWNHYQRRPLHYAAMAPNPDACRVLIEAGADVNARERFHEDGNLPLMYAMYPDQIQNLKLLIFAGSEYDVTSGWLLQIAVKGGDLELCRFLYEKGASLDVRDHTASQGSLLHLAAERGDIDVCRWLLEVGVDVNSRNDRQETPLILAAQRNHIEICKLLLENGADISAAGVQGTALQVAPRQRDSQDNAALLDLLQSTRKQCESLVSSPVKDTENDENGESDERDEIIVNE